MCGTIDYLPPEMILNQDHDTNVRPRLATALLPTCLHTLLTPARHVIAATQADIWCLGVLAYEFLCGHAPFEAPDSKQVWGESSAGGAFAERVRPVAEHLTVAVAVL